MPTPGTSLKSFTLNMAGRRDLVTGPTMAPPGGASSTIWLAWSTAFPTRSNLGTLVPQINMTAGPVSIAMAILTSFLVAGSLRAFLQASRRSRLQSTMFSTGESPLTVSEYKDLPAPSYLLGGPRGDEPLVLGIHSVTSVTADEMIED